MITVLQAGAHTGEAVQDTARSHAEVEAQLQGAAVFYRLLRLLAED